MINTGKMEDIRNIGIELIAAYAAGFTLGVRSPFRRAMEHIEQIELAAPDEMKKNYGFKQKDIDSIKKGNKKLEMIVPLLMGSIYTFISHSLIRKEQVEPFSLLTNVASCYAGYWSGVGIRSLFNKEHRNDMEILRNMKENPEIVPEYIPEEAKMRLESSLDNIESLVMNSELPSDEHKESIMGACAASVNPSKAYAPIILNWVKGRIQERLEMARHQKIIKGFYEPTYSMPFFSPCGLVGEYRGLKGRVFKKEGDSLLVESIEWDSIDSIKRDGAPFMEVKASPPIFSTLSHEAWTPDYRKLVERIKEENKQYTTFIALLPEKIPKESYGEIVTCVLVNYLADNKIISPN